MPYSFYFDSEQCIKCKSCEVACRQWKGIQAGTIKLRRVEEVVSGVFPEVRRQFFSLSCRHCTRAPCLEACPTKAIVKRPDGIIIVNRSECIGCKACLEKCPFGVPQFAEDGLMYKCDMCLDRIENGRGPICAETCPTQALGWGTLAEIAELAAKKADQYLT